MLAIVILIAAVFVPSVLGVAGLWLYRKWQDRAGRTSPIAGKRIFGAGEQLRIRIEDETDKMLAALLILFFIGPYFVAAWALQKVNWAGVRFDFGSWMFVAAFLLMFAWAMWKILRHGGARRRCIAGLKAELFTAQELNRLIAAGCTVLHDIPGDGFNLDHVVVGPGAVYMVETKSFKKPRKSGSGDHFKVRYDGDSLHFPDFVTRAPIDQARRQRQWLITYLKQATSQSVPVLATVALPGWWIESSRPTDPDAIRVINPSGRGASFMAEAGAASTLTPGLAALVVQALVMRHPVAEK